MSSDLFFRAASRAFSDELAHSAFLSLWCVANNWESKGRTGDAAVIMEMLAGLRNFEMGYLISSARLLKKSRRKRKLREWRKASSLANYTIWDVARSAAAHYVEEDHQMALDLGQMLLADAERRADGDAVRNFAYFVHLANEAIFANRAISEPATGQTINEDTEKQIDAD
jgi:hypothetical protein